MKRFRFHRSVIAIALAFVIVQCYVLYSSTYHVFKHDMPMCPICVAMKSYTHANVAASHLPLLNLSFDFQVFPVLILHARNTEQVYLSRAPPANYPVI